MTLFKVRLRTLALGAICALLLAVLLPGVLLHGFSLAASMEIRRRPALTENDHNGLKHAYAAAEVYSWLRPVFGPERARATVIRLGKLNEFGERYIKPQVDWSPEAYKDMRNNLTGVLAAEWLYGQGGFVSPFARLSVIGRLAEDGIVIAVHTDPHIPDLPRRPDRGEALARMEKDEAALEARIAADIAARAPGLRLVLGLDQP